jgi:hypothetical protein
MRPKERIPVFFKLIDWKKLKERWNIDLAPILKFDNITEINRYWEENPDQRFGQVLINLGFAPDEFKVWNDEETNILLSQGIAPEEVLYWTSIFNKDETLRNKPVTKLLKDLETNHIKAILETQTHLSDLYIKTFNKILKNRNETIL